MKKAELQAMIEAYKAETQAALQELFDNVNQGQRKQLVKKDNIKKLFDKHKVSYEE